MNKQINKWIKEYQISLIEGALELLKMRKITILEFKNWVEKARELEYDFPSQLEDLRNKPFNIFEDCTTIDTSKKNISTSTNCDEYLRKIKPDKKKWNSKKDTLYYLNKKESAK